MQTAPDGISSSIKPALDACHVFTAQLLKLVNAALSFPEPLQVAAVNSDDPPPVPVQFPVVIPHFTAAVGTAKAVCTMENCATHGSAEASKITKHDRSLAIIFA